MRSSTNLHHVYMNANLRCEACYVRMHASEMNANAGVASALRSRGVRGLVLARIKA